MTVLAAITTVIIGTIAATVSTLGLLLRFLRTLPLHSPVLEPYLHLQSQKTTKRRLFTEHLKVAENRNPFNKELGGAVITNLCLGKQQTAGNLKSLWSGQIFAVFELLL